MFFIIPQLILINCKMQGPFGEAKFFHSRQKFSALYGNQKFIIVFTKSPPPYPILSQTNQAYMLQTNSVMVHFNTNIPSMTRSSKRTFDFRVYTQDPACISFPSQRSKRFATFILLDIITLIIFDGN